MKNRKVKKQDQESTTKKEDIFWKDRTDEELKQLAVDIIDGAFFSTIGMPEKDLRFIPVIFMPLTLMDEETAEMMRKRDPVVLYADMNKRMQRVINGYPIFPEVGMIIRTEFERFVSFYNEYLDIKKEFLKKDDGKKSS